MTHENLDESTKRAIELKVRSELLIESIGKYSKGEIKELVAMVDSENFKGIEAQCQQIKKLFEQIFEQNLRLVLITFYQNNIPKEEIESFLEDIRALQVNYDLLLDSMLNKIKYEAIFLERKADVMPSIVGSKNGKLNHQKSKEIKKDIQSFAKERWEKDESITRNNIIKNFKEGRNVSEQEETLKNWLAEIDPVTKRGAKRLRNGKIIEPKK